MILQQLLKIGARDLQHAAVGLRHGGLGVALRAQRRQAAKQCTLRQDVEHHILAPRAMAQQLDLAVGDEEQALGLTTLAADGAVGWVVDLAKALADLIELRTGKAFEVAGAAQDFVTQLRRAMLWRYRLGAQRDDAGIRLHGFSFWRFCGGACRLHGSGRLRQARAGTDSAGVPTRAGRTRRGRIRRMPFRITSSTEAW